MKKTDNTDNKEAKFFCECCGSEVPRKSRFCPVCGKFFASVKCPKCGHTGAPEDFKMGCPECGYAITNSNQASDASAIANSDNFSDKTKPAKQKHLKKQNKKQKQNNSDTTLPVWTYVISVLVLVILIIFLYSCL